MKLDFYRKECLHTKQVRFFNITVLVLLRKEEFAPVFSSHEISHLDLFKLISLNHAYEWTHCLVEIKMKASLLSFNSRLNCATGLTRELSVSYWNEVHTKGGGDYSVLLTIAFKFCYKRKRLNTNIDPCQV